MPHGSHRNKRGGTARPAAARQAPDRRKPAHRRNCPRCGGFLLHSAATPPKKPGRNAARNAPTSVPAPHAGGLGSAIGKKKNHRSWSGLFNQQPKAGTRENLIRRGGLGTSAAAVPSCP